jgi:hypothetical protein
MRFETQQRIEKLKMYFQGQRDGVMLYAHWKNGVQYVGTCGKTLQQAIKDINDGEENRIDILKNECTTY